MIKELEYLITNCLESFGFMSETIFPVHLIMFIGALLFAYMIYYVSKWAIIYLVKRLIEKKEAGYTNLLRKKFFHRLSYIPALIIINPFIKTLFIEQPDARDFIYTIYAVVLVIIISSILFSFLSAFEQDYSNLKYTRKGSIKGIIQATKTIIFIIATIFCISLIIGVKIGVLLTTLGAVSAVLMLVFKDSILGLVGGIQLSLNRIVLLGDWIEIPVAGADGTVIEISQISVKVQNWDNTIVTVPTYNLVSQPVKNWRGMSEAGVRRIKRSIYIDMTSVKFCSEKMLEQYRKIQYITDYIDKKQEEIIKDNKENQVNAEIEINGRRQTNLGIFRAYAQCYLEHHPQLNSKFTLMARQLDPTANGLPIEIYAFVNTTEWLKYESIQSDIFDHLISALPYFDLRIFQNPSGNDYKETTKSLTKSIQDLKK